MSEASVVQLHPVDPWDPDRTYGLAVTDEEYLFIEQKVAALDEHHDWADARRSEIEHEKAKYHKLLVDRCLSGEGPGPWLRELNEYHRITLRSLVFPGWMPERRRRRMPTAGKIVRYWAGGIAFPAVDYDEPACFRCAAPALGWNHLERAHLIDRCQDGLDHEANIVMLCGSCHGGQPRFAAGDEAEVLQWAGADYAYLAEWVQ